MGLFSGGGGRSVKLVNKFVKEMTPEDREALKQIALAFERDIKVKNIKAKHKLKASWLRRQRFKRAVFSERVLRVVLVFVAVVVVVNKCVEIGNHAA